MIPFLKDALDLRPETEVVQEFQEGLPGKIIRFDSLRLQEKDEFTGEEKKTEVQIRVYRAKTRQTLVTLFWTDWAAGGARGQPSTNNCRLITEKEI